MELGQIASITKLAGYEFTKDIQYIDNGEIIAIRALNVKNGKLDLSQAKRISKDVSNKLVRSKLFKNEIVLTYTGSKYGEVALVKENDKFHLAPNVCKITVNDNNIIPYYVLLIMQTSDFKMQLKNYGVGSSQPTIPMKNIRKLQVAIPSISYQKEVLRIIEPINKKLELNQEIIENLEELSQTLFKRWFVDFEFPDENGNPYKSSGGDMVESELSKIPKSWKVDTLGNYIKIKSGKRPKCKVDNKDFENVVPVIGASKIMGYTNDYIYNEKIIIIGRVGTHGVIQRFSTRTWPSDNTFVITSDFESIIYQLLKSIDYISLNRGSTQPLLSQKDIKNTKVAMPTNETLLYKYQNENDHILKMMDQKNIENQKLAQLRDTLLPKLMSGEIEIPDDIEVMEDELSI